MIPSAWRQGGTLARKLYKRFSTPDFNTVLIALCLLLNKYACGLQTALFNHLNAMQINMVWSCFKAKVQNCVCIKDNQPFICSYSSEFHFFSFMFFFLDDWKSSGSNQPTKPAGICRATTDALYSTVQKDLRHCLFLGILLPSSQTFLSFLKR